MYSQTYISSAKKELLSLNTCLQRIISKDMAKMGNIIAIIQITYGKPELETSTFIKANMAIVKCVKFATI